MRYRLRDGVSFCVAGNRTVFLDIENDKYFCLPLPAEPSMQRFLQLDGRLEASDVHSLSPLLARGILVEETGAGQLRDHQPKCRDARRSLDHGQQTPSWTGSVRALVRLRATRWKLKRRGAPAMLRLAGEAKAALGSSPDAIEDGLAAISASFDRMGLLLTAHEQCLPRSLALSAHLSAERYAHELVIGVKMRPFDAHCWVQVGETVINDTLERTSIFAPILVL